MTGLRGADRELVGGAHADAASGEPDDEVLLARAYLSRVSEPANLALWALVRSAGPVAAVRAIRTGQVSDAVRAATEARRGSVDPEADLTAGQQRGIRLIGPESPEWPHFAFAALEHAASRLAAEPDTKRAAEKSIVRRDDSGDPVPPLALWARGHAVEPATLGIRAVAIVGSRAATAYGEHVTAELAYGLARRDVTVVSGGAYGIDAAAHRAALAAAGRTVVVSAGGLDRPYPAGNATLYDRAAESGLLLSESPPGAAPHRARFLTRNRVIAALAAGVVVVEASSRSGATNTARHARLLGRPVMAVPGPVTSAMSVGCHNLLRRETEPAVLITCVDDVLAVVGSAGEGLPDRSPPRTPDGDVRPELDELDPLARRVFDGLPVRRFATPEELALRTAISPLDVVRSLPALELAGLAEVRDGRYRVAARVRDRKS